MDKLSGKMDFVSLSKSILADSTRNDYSTTGIGEKFLEALKEREESPKDKKFTDQLDSISILPINQQTIPQPQTLYYGEIEKIVGQDTKDYSAVVNIKNEIIEIWIAAELAQHGLAIGDIHSVDERFNGLNNWYLNLPIPESFNSHHLFAASTAFHRLFLHLPENLVLSNPIIVNIDPNSSNEFLPIHLVNNLTAGASCEILLRINPDEGQNSVHTLGLIIENILDTNAKLTFYEFQDLSSSVTLFSMEHTTVKSKADFEKFILDRGASRIIRTSATLLDEIAANAMITGLYSCLDEQAYAYDTFQNHRASNTRSDLLFKGVLDDKANVLWRGNIRVSEKTSGADGYQVNNNLLLKTSAFAESIPGLEILTDDVRCSHGVTVRNVDPDQVFYLKSRGIGEDSAIRLISSGFFEATLNRIGSERIRHRITQDLLDIQ